MMAEISKKYFVLFIRLEKIRSDKGMWSIRYSFKPARGLHVFLYKIYFSFYIRFGKK